MTSYYGRYLRGEHEAVWAELRALGPLPDELWEDAAAVAEETMVRVGQHVARIAAALPELGWVSSDRLVEPHQPPTGADNALVDSLVTRVGLPLSLEACLRHVGEVWFAGDCELLFLTYHQEPTPTTLPPGPDYPDPLCLGNAYHLAYELDEGPADRFALAPDELHKANLSGGTHDVPLGEVTADADLLGVAGRDRVGLVEYLRTSIAWGGFPGWSFRPELAPEALITLRCDPDF
ncbi:hypothetical protein [Actinokineospora bangkokensis]|uniref:Uncharacterized protein n=1 Tax=Actinokineospora bangkokensis TaxID=1193682 RepID=A0A1Q9LI28_9PSEU|nr:hypothetical protein [Actinokineospora bangkokensis]OLR91609.1 hypothetical protein BJP25_25985 [Actinokineospora bangkokensis]